MYLQKIISCINLQLPIVISNKSIIADIRHRITYMYIHFYKKWVNIDQSKTMHTHLFANNRKLHKFAITYSNFEKKIIFQTCIIV